VSNRWGGEDGDSRSSRPHKASLAWDFCPCHIIVLRFKWGSGQSRSRPSYISIVGRTHILFIGRGRTKGEKRRRARGDGTQKKNFAPPDTNPVYATGQRDDQVTLIGRVEHDTCCHSADGNADLVEVGRTRSAYTVERHQRDLVGDPLLYR
jgi:hypothetical protein